MTAADFHWDELSSAEVVARLEHLAQSGQEPVSGFIDIHQWLPLLDRPGLQVDGGFAESQFRRVRLGEDPPELVFYNIPIDSLPTNARQAHGARTFMKKLVDIPGAIGDVQLGSHLSVAACPGLSLDSSELALQQTSGWSPPKVKPARVTCAANRMDAVVSALFRVSRDEARTALQYAFIYVNLAPVTKRTQSVRPGDLVIFRSKGRAEIVATGTNPRSNRTWLDVMIHPA